LCLAALAAPAQASTAFGYVEFPAAGSTVYGIVAVGGWVLDINAVDNIKIYVDGVYVNTADINIPRADVLNVFPTYANSPTARPGFISSFSAKNYSNGAHSITVRATESNDPSNPVTIGTVPVTIDNTINQPPFGYIDQPFGDNSTIEGPGAGVMAVYGWAVDDGFVDHVDFLVDGQIVAGAVCCNIPGDPSSGSTASTAIYGGTRPDVQAAFPDLANSLYSGFGANIDTTALINGIHVLSVRVTDDLGASRVIGTRTIQVDNASLNLHPFGTIDFPLDELTFLPACNLGGLPCVAEFGEGVCPSGVPPAACSAQNFVTIKGWVLDAGSRRDFGQTGYVELLIDGVVIANTRRDCVVASWGAFENCYGVNRPDVEQNYPGYVNSDNAGYVFDFVAIDDGSGHLAIGIPLPSGDLKTVDCINPGKHTVAVRAGDDEETVASIGIPFSANFVTCPANNDHPAIGYVDEPFNYQFVDGIASVDGWAFDSNGVQYVQIDIDGQVVCDVRGETKFECGKTNLVCIANYGDYRPDVPLNDARVSGNTHTGFDFLLDTTKLADSAHDLNVYVVDKKCIRTLIGRRKFVVNNNVPTHGP
jgi:hypothetical protein